MSESKKHVRNLLARHRLPVVAATSSVVEALEKRQLMCADHAGHLVAAPVATDIMRRLAATTKTPAVAPSATQTKTVKTVTLTKASVVKSVTKAVDAQAAIVAAAAVADPVTFSTTANGLPILNSRPDGQGLKVFIDWDGASGSGYNDDGFSTDGDQTTFNTAEQAVIYSTWRDIVSAFSFLNVNVTTVQPPVGGSNPSFVWQRITNSRAGGAAYVNWIVNYESHGYNNTDNALYRHSGIYHELGHQLGLDHQSVYDNYGAKTAEYTNPYDTLHGVIMGVDYSGNIKKWTNGRDTYGADSFQNDPAAMADIVNNYTSGDGYRPDDFTGDTLATATTLPITNGAYQTAGIIERLTDADYFSFSTSGGAWNVNVEPTFDTGLEPKLEVYTLGGTLVASINDALYRNKQDNNSEELNLNLAAGTYVAKVSSAGNIGDQGEYAFYAAPLPDGWQSVDVNRGNTGRGGYITYDDAAGTFYQGGSGANIAGTSDAFRFTYQTLTGNGSITARVDRLDNSNSLAKAGVMIRQSLDSNAANAFIGIYPTGGIAAVSRTTVGGTAANVGDATTAVGPWVRVTRVGNALTLAYSSNGTTWTNIGSSTVTMTGPVLIGLATTSRDSNALTTSAFSNVSFTGTTGTPAVTYNGLTAPAGLTGAPVATQSTAVVLNWTDGAGETGYRIERSVDNVNFSTVGTVGANLTTYTDNTDGFGSMRFWYRVTALTSSGYSVYSTPASVLNKPKAPATYQAVRVSATKISLSWRDVNGDTGYRVERSSDGGVTYNTLGTTNPSINTYNDSTTVGGMSYGYRITPLSPAGDGVPLTFNVTSQPVAPTGVTLTNPTNSATSLTINWTAVTNAAGYRVYRSTDNKNFAQVGTISSNATVTFADTGLTALTNYYYYVVAVAADNTLGVESATVKGSTAPATPLPSTWLDADVGSVTGLGDAGPGTTTGSFIINTSGANIADPDGFHFAYQPLSGNATIVARVAALSDTSSDFAKAGLMVRQNLTSSTSPYAGIFINAAGTNGIDARSRATAGANYTYGQLLPSVTAPYWLKLQRAGNVFTMSYSTDGANWTVGTTRTVAMTGTVYIGLASTAQSTTLMNTASFTDVSLLTTGAPTVATAASATPNPVTGTTTNVSVLGTSASGESSLVYDWSATGPGLVTFSAAGTNAAKNAVATFTKAGTYTLTAAITDSGFNTVTSSVTVTVNQTFSGIGATQPTTLAGFGQQISAVDQFGSPMSVSGFTWSASTGSISSSGYFIAPATGSSSVVSGTLNGTTYTTTLSIVSPTAWYKADAASGNVLTDSSGNAKTGTVVGTAGTNYNWASGEIDNALTLANGGYATMPSGILTGLSAVTIAGWVKLDATSTFARIFDFGTSSTNTLFLVPKNSDGYARFGIKSASGNKDVLTTTAIPTGAWTHFAAVMDGTTMSLYVNGVLAGSVATTLTPSALGNTTANYLGKSVSSGSDPYLNGSLDDVRIYGGAANAANVAALYAAGQTYASSTPSNVSATAVSPTQVNIAWTDNGTAELGYRIERATNAAFTAGLTAVTVAANSTSYADTTVAASTTYYYRVTTLLAGGTTTTPVVAPAVITPSAAVVPAIAGFKVNDGVGQQRSMVTSLTLSFSQPVNLGANAVVLSGVSNVNYTLSTLDSGLTYVLTFSGTGFDGGSLADGNYTLHVNHDAVTGAAGGLALAADADYTLWRLYGDVDGDRGVSINDFNTLATAFGTSAGNSAFSKALDYDNDDGISINDFNQFATRFGKSI